MLGDILCLCMALLPMAGIERREMLLKRWDDMRWEMLASSQLVTMMSSDNWINFYLYVLAV